MRAQGLQQRAGIALACFAVAAAWLVLKPAAPQAALRFLGDLCSAAARPMFSSAPAAAGAAGTPATIVKLLSCEPLANAPGKAMATLLVEFPPLARSAPHRHPGAVSAFIVEGTLRSQREGEPAPIDYTVGQTFFEQPMMVHLLAENRDPVHRARLLAVFVTDENCGPLTLPVAND